jgi:hypothetical protein
LFTPETLTGALVMEIRTSRKLSRVEFSRLAGFEGRSTARLNNIERNESWKPGDREKVAAVLNQLVPNFDPRYMPGGGTTVAGPDLRAPVLIPFSDNDDDPEESLLEVGTTPIPQVPPSVELDEPVVISPPEILFTVPADHYPISNSELQTWKRCRRKWWLAWYRKLALATETFVGVRSVGDRIHRALQQWYVPDGQPRVDPRNALERVIVEDWTKIAQLARERQLEDEQLGVLAKEFADSTNLERAMIEGYVQWLEETGADAELRVIASETPLMAKLEDASGRPIALIGKLDVRVKRVTDDVSLVLDHKTVGDLKSPAVTLPQNEQMLHYMLLEWLNSDEGEKRCDGALYNMLKRTKRSSRATPPFYDRIEVRHNPYELAAYRRRMLAASSNIMDAIERLDAGDSHFDVVYPSPRGECKWDCDFFAICNLFDDGSAGTEDMINVLYKTVDPRDRYDVKVNDE